MERKAHRGAILHNSTKRDWEGFYGGILEHQNRWYLPLHLLWHTFIRIINQIWQWYWLAIILSAHRKQREVKVGFVNYFHASPGGPLCRMWCSSWPCLWWWPTTHRKALLYQQCFLKTEAKIGMNIKPEYQNELHVNELLLFILVNQFFFLWTTLLWQNFNIFYCKVYIQYALNDVYGLWRRKIMSWIADLSLWNLGVGLLSRWSKTHRMMSMGYSCNYLIYCELCPRKGQRGFCLFFLPLMFWEHITRFSAVACWAV